MCGLAGQVRPGGVDATSVERMLAALAHRGPDDAGLYRGDAAALGHRRLSIIDLGGGRQPIANEDRTIWVVLNGEIYNYQELRQELLDRGHAFRTDSDTEVIVHLYEELGPDCVQKLRGMFAFALWDEPRRRLLAARDRFGQKPFYYAQQGSQLSFASEIKALLALDPGLAELDPEALEEYLALRIVMPPRSMYRRIRKLPPAHRLIYEPEGELRIERYWDLDFEPKLQEKEPALLDALEEQLVESLRLHTVSDVPVGAFLSGGLDSTLIVALLSRHGVEEPLHTFTGSLAYGRHDEAPAARAVAEQYGTRHHERQVTPSLVNLLPRLLAQLDEPADSLSVCSYLLAELAREHVKVVLGGDGGDELFGGYDRYYGHGYADHYARIPAALRRHGIGGLLRLLPDSAWYKGPTHQLRWLQRLSFLEGGSRYAGALGYFYFDDAARAALHGPVLAAGVRGFDPSAPIVAAYENAPAEHPVDRMLYADGQLRLPDHSLMILDRTSMAHGLEARSPFLDHRLAEFCARLPVEHKVRGRSLRTLQRKLAERYLPAEVLRRPKQGFSSALPYMLRDEYRLLFRLFLRESWLARDEILHAPEIARLLAEHETGRVDHAQRLWLLLSSELWYRLGPCKSSADELSAEIAEAE